MDHGAGCCQRAVSDWTAVERTDDPERGSGRFLDSLPRVGFLSPLGDGLEQICSGEVQAHLFHLLSLKNFCDE